MVEFARFICRKGDLRPLPTDACRWLDIPDDIALLSEYAAHCGHAPMTRSECEQIARDGFTYAAVVQDGVIVSMAAWQRSASAWELAAVSTRTGHRRQGYGAAVCAFMTDEILAKGRQATCTTRRDSVAMIATARELGYAPLPEAPDSGS
ncbi:hypothetical protein HOK31_06825 [Candidatus Poribacteria bacterium]|nr:hypothetical protein [Candidatus Poribacteria bacterium]